MIKTNAYAVLLAAFILAGACLSPGMARADGRDLEQVREAGVLRHIGIPYANFVTGNGDGLDVEIMQRFAAYLGVRYEYVQSDWSSLFGDLTGTLVEPDGDDVTVVGESQIRGDIIANGLTVLPWREKVVSYSTPTFPTQVWCIARADFPADPIVASGDLQEDILKVKALLEGQRVLGKNGTCLTPSLYGIDESIARIMDFPGSLNDIAPAIIKGDADIALLDVPDVLVALEKWPGKIKVLGPLSDMQLMGAGFRPESPELLEAFNVFFAELRESGEYESLIRKYYPAVFLYYEDFFK